MSSPQEVALSLAGPRDPPRKSCFCSLLSSADPARIGHQFSKLARKAERDGAQSRQGLCHPLSAPSCSFLDLGATCLFYLPRP